jgi:hypothetical protein
MTVFDKRLKQYHHQPLRGDTYRLDKNAFHAAGVNCRHYLVR